MKDLKLSTQTKNTDVDVEKASASEDAATAMQRKALQIVNLSPSESIVEKLTEIHPMRQITYASIIQVAVFFGMLGAFQINSWIFSA
jgi:hypothetical protein